MTRKVRAAMFVGANQPLQIVEKDVPQLREGEVFCRVEACTICGSDVRTFSGQRSSPTPSVLGHEIVGRVEAIEGEVRDLRGETLGVGDRLVWSVAANCGVCDRCSRGAPQKCRQLTKYGHQADDERGGLYGGMAEYCLLVRGAKILRLNETLPSQLAAPASCATATVCASVRAAGDLEDRRVFVFGAGALGLTAAAMASTQKAREIVMCDPDDQRSTRALAMGADKTLAPQDCNACQGGADVVFEMSGSPEAVEAGLDALDIGGRLILVGSVAPSRKVMLDPEAIVRRLIRVEGVHNYVPQDLLAAIDFLTTHADEFPFAGMVEAEFSLENANQAMQFAMESRPLRVLIRPE